MEFPTALLRDLLDLTSSVGLDDDELEIRLAGLMSALHAAVPSHRGMQLTLVDGAQAVSLSAFDSTEAGEIGTSLRLPFAALAPGFHPGSRFLFYAATAGALVDLAADLGYALQVPVIFDGSDEMAERHRGAGPRISGRFDDDGQAGREHRDGRTSIILDADLPPTRLVSGLTGLGNMSTINRAVGMLIDQGHHPDAALALIHRRAAAAGVEPHRYAAQLLGR